MFGYLGAPCASYHTVGVGEYRRYFCGLCNVLARDYGLPARGLINRDSTALALLWGALRKEAPPLALATCCNPWGRRQTLCQQGSGMAFAAAVTLAGLETRAADGQADEHGLARWGWLGLGHAGRGRFGQARRTLDRLGFDVTAVDRNLARQTALEQEITAGRTTWQQAAEPTAASFAALAAHQASLAGQPQAQPHAAALGAHLGRAIYWLDALQDWDRDQSLGRFNPLPHREAAADLLLPELRGAEAVLQALPLARHHALLAEVLVRGPHRHARRLLAGDDGEDTGESGEPASPDEPHRPQRRVPGAAPGPCEQGCSACGDFCYLSDGICQVVRGCNDCCDSRGPDCCDCGTGDGCCDCSCDCPCDCGGSS